MVNGRITNVKPVNYLEICYISLQNQAQEWAFIKLKSIDPYLSDLEANCKIQLS